ncbi:hypothetical protein D3C76_1637650 [compost metagenome]
MIKPKAAATKITAVKARPRFSFGGMLSLLMINMPPSANAQMVKIRMLELFMFFLRFYTCLKAVMRLFHSSSLPVYSSLGKRRFTQSIRAGRLKNVWVSSPH